MIDVIIKSWNAVQYTKLAIKTIKETLLVPHHIIVVDDASDQDALRELERINNIELIRHSSNLGPAQIAITGFEASTSETVVLMDNDIVVEPGWLERMLPYFDDPKVAIVSPLKISNSYMYPGKNISTRDYWEKIEIEHENDTPTQLLDTFLNGKTLERFRRELVSANNITDQELLCPPAFTSSCFILMNRNLIKKAGGIARQIFRKYGGEDVDLCWRIGQAGSKIIKTCKVYVHHFEHSSMEANNQDIKQHLSDSNIMLYNLWSEKILSEAKALRKKYPNQVDSLFPFIKVMETIKNHGNARTF